MPNIAYPPARQLSVGEVLDLTFRIYRATVIRCMLLAALGVLASQLWRLYALARGLQLTNLRSLPALLHDPQFVALYIVGILAQTVLMSAVILRQYRLITGPESAAGDVAAATRRLPAIIALGILFTATCGACFLPALVGGALRPLFVLFCLAALSYVLVALLSAHTILLTEGSGPLASYQRSWRLTRGSFWRLSVVYFIALLILLAIYWILLIIIGVLGLIIGRGDVAVMTATGAVLGVALGALVAPFYTALSIAILGDLKVRREGTDLEQRIAASA
jgi:hypothetical protein